MDILETERLVLAHLTAEDAPFIFELLNTPAWLQFIGDRGIKTPEDASRYIMRGPVNSYQKNGFGLYLVRLKDTRHPAGLCGLIKRESLDDVDIGFAFLPAYNGKGYAFEAAAATLHYGFSTLGLKRIVAITNEDNSRSIHLLEKLGLRFERKVLHDGEAKELMLFATP